MAWQAAAGAAAGGVLGSGISAISSAREAKKARKFQRKVMNNAYQWTMGDMKAAGLNPILAYQRGATGSPGANMGQTPDFGQALASGIDAGTKAGRQPSEVEKNRAQAEQSIAQRDVLKGQKWLVEAQARLTDATWQETMAKATLVQNQIPASNLRRKYYESQYGKNLTPVLTGAQDFLGPLSELIRIFK